MVINDYNPFITGGRTTAPPHVGFDQTWGFVRRVTRIKHADADFSIMGLDHNGDPSDVNG